ncbi:hypothetical protein [Roseovarius aestuarii]|uniref:NADH dehydrogenase subunit E n=1 Tax=Roseovarius aestuarii TaxID=475083 RepID=A0A1X7BMY9_9RHOB|nr:hypothetical protein [Roseovarius aestuarii]SMC10880.1 hypothetical protein ROA7745_00688 [Roseovarius aestuarii]
MKTGIRLGIFGIAIGLSGCALPPDGVSQQDIANYEAAVASIGCVMAHESDYLPVEFQAGLTREQTLAITKYELAAERAVSLPEGGVKLTTGACAG